MLTSSFPHAPMHAYESVTDRSSGNADGSSKVVEYRSLRKWIRAVALSLVMLLLYCDAEAQWSSQTSGTANNLFSVHFATANEGWAVGFSNTILHTTDGGTSWAPQSSPGGIPVSSYLGVRFLSTSVGWTGGAQVVLRTTDGGANWVSAGADPSINKFRNNLFAVSETVAWVPTSTSAVSPAQRWLSRFTVPGAGEQDFDPIVSAASHLDIYFTDADNGWAVGISGVIRRITNASTAPSLSNQTSGTAQTLNGIFMLDSSTGWIVGNTGTVLQTTNGGSTWTPQTSGTANNLRSVYFTDASNGWVVGAAGTILNTTNGGSNWAPETSPVSTELRRVFFMSGVGYAVGHSGTIIKRAGATECTLESFTATGYDGGQVLLKWSTAFEVNNLGFNVYRDRNGKRTRLNEQILSGSALVAGSVALTAGRDYAWWVDAKDASKDSAFWLEDLDLSGASTWRGPFPLKQLGGKPPAQSQAPLLSSIGRQDSDSTHIVASVAELVRANQSVISPVSLQQASLASSRAVKISVKHGGWYRVTHSEIVAAGFDVKADPRLLRLYVDGKELPIIVVGEDDGRFDASDSMEFYGVGLNTASTDTRVYWLIGGSQPGLRINKTPFAKGYPAGESFAYTVERRDRTIYFSALRNGDEENFFGAVVTGNLLEQRLTLNNLASSAKEAAVIEFSLQGVTNLPHQVSVCLNGSSIGRLVFDGQSKAWEKIEVAQAMLRAGENIVTLQSINGPGDVSLVDAIRITYQHSYLAENDALSLTAKGGETATINGFSSKEIRVFDATDERNVQELGVSIDQTKDGYAASVTASAGGDRKLLALTEGKALQATNIKANTPSHLRDAGNLADFIIISEARLTGALKPLVILRSKQGLVTALVDIEDIYDEFSYGEKSPQAVKDFLAFARGRWKLTPRFVLFAGDASFDPRNYLGAGDFDFVPTRLIDTTYLETASDDWFVDFNDDGLPEMYVGRLPVRTPAEGAALVSKIVSYDSAKVKSPIAGRSVLLVADKNDGFNFEEASEQLRALVPTDTGVQEIFRGRLDDAAAKKQLIEAINAGQTIVNYTGHGSTNVWRSLFTTEDARSLNNRKGFPLFVAMTCLTGFFQEPVTESLAEALLKSERGGAIAVWASSGLTEPAQQAVMNQHAYSLLFAGGRGLTIGEVASKAKASVSNIDIRRTWILFGDPTTRLK